jgi:hypothetical protein
LRSTISPRSAIGMGCRAEVSWGKIGCVDTPTNPVIDAVGCSSHGHGAPSLRVEGRPRQADHRLPLELNCYSEELSPRAAASVMAARGEPLSSLLPVRADYLTRRRKSGSRHLLLPAPCRYAAGRRSPPQSHGCQNRTPSTATFCFDDIFFLFCTLRQSFMVSPAAYSGAACERVLAIRSPLLPAFHRRWADALDIEHVLVETL